MGGEFKIFEHFIRKEGIALRHSWPYLHEQNGKVERKYRDIMETSLILLTQAKIPLKYQREAFNYATFLINRLTSPILGNKTPFELLYSIKPNYSQIKVFGSECYPYLRLYRKHKFDFHTSKCILLGISVSHKGYVCMHHLGRVYILASVKFKENLFLFQSDSNFCKRKLTDQNHFTTALKRFQVLSFSIDVPSESTQPETSHSHYQAITGSLEQSLNLDQDETHQTLGSNTISDNHSLVQPLSNTLEENHTLSRVVEPNTQTTSTQRTLPTYPMITRSKARIFK